jgi:glycosyltransferase involved in cell wall biosynthesis
VASRGGALTGRDIICLSTHYWDGRRFRKQEFMSRFARSNRVLYVEPSFSMARRPEAHLRELASNRFLLSTVEERAGGLHLFKPPRGIPKWNAFPRIEKLTYEWFGRTIARAAGRLGFRDAVLWMYEPSYAHALDAIPHRDLVFDLVDDLSAYPYGGDRDARAAVVEGQVTGIVERSDLLVVTARTLLDRYGPRARNAVQVSNGFDARIFSPNGATGPPAALADVPRPILGFIGTIFTFLDFDLLAEVAKAHPDKSLVLVGPVERTAADEFSELAKLPNVFHVGPQPQSDIPSYVAAFDVCVNPFATGPAADSVSPLKVYEYLAMGRPVVSVPMKALQMEDAARAVAFADGPREFSEQVELCLTDEVQQAAPGRIETARDYSWDRLFERLESGCDDALAR